MCSCSDCGFCFFQAEDGIRDLVRSRGLGDVYKRQQHHRREPHRHLLGQFGRGQPVETHQRLARPTQRRGDIDVDGKQVGPVSYTHLTLPTSDLV